MEKEEILEKASKKKAVMGEMESQKIGKANWISLVVAAVFVTGFCIAEGALGHPAAIYAILAIIAAWACSFYTLQYFVAKRSWQVLIGAAIEFVVAVGLIVVYVLSYVYGW